MKFAGPGCAIFVLFIAFAPAVGLASDAGQQVDVYLAQQMAKYGIPGVSIAVVKNSDIVKLKGYGLASIELDVPATEVSVFQIYSVTKIFAVSPS